MSQFKSNMSSICVQRSPLKLEPLVISQKEKDKLNSSHQLISERLNSQKILFNYDKENDKYHQRMFYSPQSRKLPKINLTDSQLKIQSNNNNNESESLIGRSINILSGNQRKLHSLERQHSDSIKYSNMTDLNIKQKVLNKQSIQDSNSSILQDSLMYPSNMKDSVIRGIQQHSNDVNKIKTKSFKGYTSQLLTSVMDLPIKVNRNFADLSPKRVLKRNINKNSKSSDKKQADHQKESILNAYRYDKEFIHLNDEESKIHAINNKNKISKDLHTKMLIQYTQLQKLYTNQMNYFDRITEELQKKNSIETHNRYNNDYSQYGEYQSILEKFQLQQIEEDGDIELHRFIFEKTVFNEVLESLIEGCSQSIKDELQFLYKIFNRIIYTNTNSKLHSYLYNLVSKPSYLEKSTTYAEGLQQLIDYIKEKEDSLNKSMQIHKDQVKSLEEQLAISEEKVERLTKQNKQFDDQRKKQEEEYKQKQSLLLEEIQQKRYILENEIKKDKEVLKIELASMERDFKEKTTELQTIIVQKIEETQYYKNIYDKQEQRYSQLKVQYDILFENQAQSIKQMRFNSVNINNLQEKLNFQDSQIRSITQKNGMKFQELTPRPSFKNVDVLIEEYQGIIGQSNKSSHKLEKDNTNNDTQTINENNSNIQEQPIEDKSTALMLEQVSTQTKVNEVNDFIAQLIQKIKKQQQDFISLQNLKAARATRPK